MVDVSIEITINRPIEEVTGYAADPANAPEWYVNIRSVEEVTAPPLRQGSKVAFVAKFLGRTLTYTYEIVELALPHQLVMRTAEGPFPMETTYSWVSRRAGATTMTLRNRGEPGGFSKVVAPFLGLAMRRANGKDLQRLKAILEGAILEGKQGD